VPKFDYIYPKLPPDPFEDNEEEDIQLAKEPEQPKPKKKNKNLALIAGGLAFFTGIAVIAMIIILVSYFSDLDSSERLSQNLRQQFEYYVHNNETITVNEDGTMPLAASPAEEFTFYSPFDVEMRRHNPNYVAWITIPGTSISYPVVRYTDNYRYLDVAFDGSHSSFGTIFMDYRNRGDFVPHIIMYGHNTYHGNMFSDLHLLLEPGFRSRNNRIMLLVNGRIVEFEIFAARRTTIHDRAYFLDFTDEEAWSDYLRRIGAPADVRQILTLSTCIIVRDPSRRVVVQAFLVE